MSAPCISGNEWKYVKECLDTGWVSSAGRYVELFEQRVAEYTGANHAVACVNGTAALQVALRLVGVTADSEVLVPTLTFIAPVNAVRYLGAEPVFMDCDEYCNLDVDKTADFIEKGTFYRNGATYDRMTRKRIAAVVPVHVFGNAVRMARLLEICRDRNVAVVEDASESLGTRYKGGPLDGMHTGTVAEIGCLSFNGNKIVTTGGGGMLLISDECIAEKAKYLTTQAKDDPVRYVHNEVGYNFRLSNVLAAIGVAQLEQLPDFLHRKRLIYLAYNNLIGKIRGLKLAETPDYADCNHWLCSVRIDEEAYGRDRECLMKMLELEGIQSRPVWRLNHRQIPFRTCRSYRIRKAHAMYRSTLSIPSSATLDNSDIEKVVRALAHG